MSLKKIKNKKWQDAEGAMSFQGQYFYRESDLPTRPPGMADHELVLSDWIDVHPLGTVCGKVSVLYLSQIRSHLPQSGRNSEKFPMYVEFYL